MAGSRRSGMVVLGCVGTLVVGSITCCGGGTVAFVLVLVLAPGLLLRLVEEGQPLQVASVARDPVRIADVQARVDASKADHTVPLRITGEELTMWAFPTPVPEVPVLNIAIDAQDNAVMDVSFQPDVTDAHYVNVHLRGTFAMEHGWFTSAAMDQFTISGWDLGPYLVGQDLTAQANKSMADQRAQDPKVDAAMQQIGTLGIHGGAFDLTYE
jgi:hypothetical protein